MYKVTVNSTQEGQTHTARVMNRLSTPTRARVASRRSAPLLPPFCLFQLGRVQRSLLLERPLALFDLPLEEIEARELNALVRRVLHRVRDEPFEQPADAVSRDDGDARVHDAGVRGALQLHLPTDRVQRVARPAREQRRHERRRGDRSRGVAVRHRALEEIERAKVKRAVRRDGEARRREALEERARALIF
eukprot:31274-Pelagococcus_subviridis.AAC.6